MSKPKPRPKDPAVVIDAIVRARYQDRARHMRAEPYDPWTFCGQRFF